MATPPVFNSKSDKPVPSNNFPHVSISFSFDNPPEYLPTPTRMSRSHFLRLLRNVSQVRGQEPGRHSPDLDPVLLQLVIPVQHEHVECRLTAAVPNRLEIHLLGPPSRLRRRGEVLLACERQVGETCDEDQAGVSRLEQERHEGPGHDMGAGNVHVVCFCKAVPKRGSAG